VSPPIRILVVDDHAVLRAGLRMLLAAQADMDVVGEAADGEAAVAAAVEARPDVALVDITMPGAGGVRAIERIRAASPRTRVLVLTMHDLPAYVRLALAAGAAGYVVKRAADAELLSAIRAVHQGRTVVDPRLVGQLIPVRHRGREPGAAPASPLSPRERDVLELVAQGYTNQQIASRFGVSVKTVETHRARLTEKLGLRSRAELVRYALDSGLLAPPGDVPGSSSPPR
jgi:two-component system response regulator NreC